MSDDNNSGMPPVEPGPFLPVWPGHPMPRLSRPQIAVPPYPGGGGVTVPPNAVPAYNMQGIASFQGSRRFLVNTVSRKVLDAPATYRNMLIIRNISTAGINVFIDFGSDASGGSAIILAPDELIMFDSVVPQDDIYAVATAPGFISILVSVIALPT